MGKMGQTIIKGLLAEKGLTLVAAIDPDFAGSSVMKGVSLEVAGNIAEVLGQSKAQVLIDFTRPDVGGKNALEAVKLSVRPVVGTTGIPEEEIAQVQEECGRRDLAAAFIPNFSLGILALKRCARQVAPLLPRAEVIEMHHDQKLDAPSGTAISISRHITTCTGQEVPIHSVRLPGLVAHHEVLFGALGQTLSLRHDTMSRDAFLPGLFLAVRRILEVTGVKRDMEELL
jgi:4-hydroxy-tetrahydrodipicolinate reductase